MFTIGITAVPRFWDQKTKTDESYVLTGARWLTARSTDLRDIGRLIYYLLTTLSGLCSLLNSIVEHLSTRDNLTEADLYFIRIANPWRRVL